MTLSLDLTLHGWQRTRGLIVQKPRIDQKTLTKKGVGNEMIPSYRLAPVSIVIKEPSHSKNGSSCRDSWPNIRWSHRSLVKEEVLEETEGLRRS